MTVATVKDVEEWVGHIKETASDDEHAHCCEDGLWEQVLRAIAEGHPTPALLAQAALKTKEVEFARWCA